MSQTTQRMGAQKSSSKKENRGHFFTISFLCMWYYSWYLEMVRYATGMLPGHKERQWFSCNLIDHWQSYLMSLFEEDEINDDLSGQCNNL